MNDIFDPNTILGCMWFLTPAGIANMAPLLGKGILPSLAKPIDGNKTFGGQPLFGPHKTYRGLALGAATGIIVFLLQQAVYTYPFFKMISLFDYHETTWILGLLLGLGAILGDLVKSFFKRRISVRSGKTWFPFDQIDYSVGALALASFIFWPGWRLTLETIIIFLVLHIVMNLLAFVLKLKNSPW